MSIKLKLIEFTEELTLKTYAELMKNEEAVMAEWDVSMKDMKRFYMKNMMTLFKLKAALDKKLNVDRDGKLIKPTEKDLRIYKEICLTHLQQCKDTK